MPLSFLIPPVYSHHSWNLVTSNLNFKFEEVGGDSNTFIIDNLNVYNGKVTINIDWAERNIIPRQLYKVNITGE